jgi:hypothetical protein
MGENTKKGPVNYTNPCRSSLDCYIYFFYVILHKIVRYKIILNKKFYHFQYIGALQPLAIAIDM